MPKLKPLQQWYCDTCDELIQKPEDGWVEWIRQNNRVQDFRICHHVIASPRQHSEEGCYAHGDKRGEASHHLKVFLGADGMISLLSDVHVGPWLDPQGKATSGLGDAASWAETFRRLHVPYYEEARRYFARARAGGYSDDDNEIRPFLESSLLDIIQEYGDDE